MNNSNESTLRATRLFEMIEKLIVDVKFIREHQSIGFDTLSGRINIMEQNINSMVNKVISSISDDSSSVSDDSRSGSESSSYDSDGDDDWERIKQLITPLEEKLELLIKLTKENVKKSNKKESVVATTSSSKMDVEDSSSVAINTNNDKKPLQKKQPYTKWMKTYCMRFPKEVLKMLPESCTVPTTSEDLNNDMTLSTYLLNNRMNELKKVLKPIYLEIKF